MKWYPWLRPHFEQLIGSYQVGRGHHALLIQALPGMGDDALIYAITRFLMCQQPEGHKSCGKCRGCQLMQAGTHPDYYTLEPEKGKNTLGIDAVREVSEKLYEYARQGIEVPREARPITVYELLFIRHEGDELELEVHCSKGTYIRTIIDDLGEKLGCGAHVIYLRRLAVSKYPVERMVTLEHLHALVEQAQAQGVAPADLLDPLLMPMDSPAVDFPVVNLPLTSSVYFKNGNPVRTSGAPLEGLVRVTEGDEGKFIGMGEMDGEGRVAPRRLVVEYPVEA